MLKNKPPIPLCFWAVISVKVFHTNFKALSSSVERPQAKRRKFGRVARPQATLNSPTASHYSTLHCGTTRPLSMWTLFQNNNFFFRKEHSIHASAVIFRQTCLLLSIIHQLKQKSAKRSILCKNCIKV